MPTFVLRDVDPEVWSRLTRTSARVGLSHQSAIESAISYWCFKMEMPLVRVNMEGDTVASVPMGAST